MAYFREQFRSERYDEIYISPHMDDVAYSCGGRILQQRKAGVRVLVVNLFGPGKAPEQPSKPGKKNVFSDYEQRYTEELAVMAKLDADFVWLDYPELLFRPKSLGQIARFVVPNLPLPASRVHHELYAALAALFDARLADGGTVFFPLGIGFHPDHRIVTDVGRAFHALQRCDVAFYEDVPYSIVPAFVTLRLTTLGVHGKTSLNGAARTINHFVFRSLGWIAWLTLPIIWLYVLFLRLAQLLTSREDRLQAEPPPKRETRDIADVIDSKVDMMRLYPTQTEFFFAMDERLYGYLRSGDGAYREHVWRFPSFAPDSPRRALTQPLE